MVKGTGIWVVVDPETETCQGINIVTRQEEHPSHLPRGCLPVRTAQVQYVKT